MICFQGYSSASQTGPNAGKNNFPFLREIEAGQTDGPQEDFASLIQAFVELTQLMTNARNFLYPSAAGTKLLVV